MQQLQFIVIAEAAKPGVGAHQHRNTGAVRSAGQCQAMIEIGVQCALATLAWMAGDRGLQVVAPGPARKRIEVRQSRIIDEARIARAGILLAGDMSGHEGAAAGLHQREGGLAPCRRIAVHQVLGQGCRVFTVQRPAAPCSCGAGAVANEQMRVFKAVLSGLQCLFQRHRPGQVAHQRTMQLPRLGSQPLVGIRAQPVVDLQCIHAALGVLTRATDGVLWCQRRVFEVEACHLHESRRGQRASDGLCAPATLVSDAGDQRIGRLRAVHHVAGAGDAVGQHQRELQLRRQLQCVGMHVPEARQQPAATGVEYVQGGIVGAIADGDDGAVAHRHSGGRAGDAVLHVHHPRIDDHPAVADIGLRRRWQRPDQGGSEQQGRGEKHSRYRLQQRPLV
ncbi:hypothetical protein D3C81_865570 [compost metagenome]